MEQGSHSAAKTKDARKAGSPLLLSWSLYAITGCLMILVIGQTQQIFILKAQLQAARGDAARLAQSNALVGLHLVTLEVRDASYSSTKVMVAWDPYRNEGVASAQNLPPPPAGHDYQLWVLDPAAEAPLNAGLIKTGSASQKFEVRHVSVANPGFAVSLEPSGGRPAPTGSILFAIAPGQ